MPSAGFVRVSKGGVDAMEGEVRHWVEVRFVRGPASLKASDGPTLTRKGASLQGHHPGLAPCQRQLPDQQASKHDEHNGPQEPKLAQILTMNQQSSINDIMSLT